MIDYRRFTTVKDLKAMLDHDPRITDDTIIVVGERDHRYRSAYITTEHAELLDEILFEYWEGEDSGGDKVPVLFVR